MFFVKVSLEWQVPWCCWYVLQLDTKRLATPSMIPWKWYSSAEAVLVVGVGYSIHVCAIWTIECTPVTITNIWSTTQYLDMQPPGARGPTI